MTSGVEFEGDNSQYRQPNRTVQQNSPAQNPPGSQFGGNEYAYTRPETKGMAGWLMRKGIVKSESAADMVLIGVVVVNIVVTIIVIKFIL